MSYCDVCIYSEREPDDLPCKNCIHCSIGNFGFEHFNPINSGTPKQPTTPPMPDVKPPKEEINHPERYAGGKYECIDVMIDVFGVDATKSFCKLNAFKYLWREQNKNGVEDLKKCAWYLDKLIELCGDSHENV